MRASASILILSLAAGSMPLVAPLSVYADECKTARELVAKALSKGDNSTAERDLYQQATSTCSVLFEAHYNLGLLYLKTGENELAKSALSAALNLRSEDLDTRLALAAVEGNLGNLEAARSLYSLILERDANNFIALQGLGLVLTRLNEVERGLELLNRALALKPDDTDLIRNLATIMEQQNRNTEALAHYKRLTELLPEDASAWLRQGVLYFKDNQLSESLKALEEAKKRDYASRQISSLLGLINYQLGDYDRAEIELRKAINLDADDIASRITLSSVLLKQNQAALALEQLKVASSKNPTDPKILTLTGLAQLELGQYAEALNALRKAHKLKPEDPLILSNLGLVNLRIGEREKARAFFQKTLKVDPENRLAQNNLSELGD